MCQIIENKSGLVGIQTLYVNGETIIFMSVKYNPE